MAQKYGWMANQEVIGRNKRCRVCDTADPIYSWTDYSGEAYCTTCGTSYQLKWGQLKPGESYPRINVREEAIPMLRRFYQETKSLNGCGTFLVGSEYPEQMAGLRRFNAWFKEHEAEYPELAESPDA